MKMLIHTLQLYKINHRYLHEKLTRKTGNWKDYKISTSTTINHSYLRNILNVNGEKVINTKHDHKHNIGLTHIQIKVCLLF